MFDFLKRHTAQFSQLGVTTDWHCHLLAGVDDGVQTIEDSAKILGLMRDAGIRKVVHTPHINPEIFPENREFFLREKYERYLNRMPACALEGLELRLGGEYMVTDGFEKRDMSELFQIEPGKVLIEMSYMYPSATIREAVFNICMEGLTPVIAHPERYLYYAGRLEVFDELLEMGAKFQLNLLSLDGCYGRPSVRILEYLLKKHMYSYVGTDTHTVSHFERISRLEFKPDYLTLLKEQVKF